MLTDTVILTNTEKSVLYKRVMQLKMGENLIMKCFS